MPLPEGDHTLRLGFIDDPFVKTLAKERHLQGHGQQVDRLGDGRRARSPRRARSRAASKILVCDPKTGAALRRPDPVDAGAPRLPPAGHAGGSRGADEVRGAGEGRRAVDRAGHRARDPGDARLAALPVSHRARSQPDRSEPGAPDLGRGAGLAAELLPVELDAGRRAAVAGRTAPVERAGGARRAGQAHARRSEGVRDGRELRRPVAGDPQPRQHQARPAEVPGLDARAARRDEDRDADVLRLRSCARTGRSASSSTRATRSSTSSWRTTTASKASPDRSSGASSSRRPSAAAC